MMCAGILLNDEGYTTINKLWLVFSKSHDCDLVVEHGKKINFFIADQASKDSLVIGQPPMPITIPINEYEMQTRTNET